MTIIPVILAGGGGTRLWPVSRELHPKPFIRLADDQNLLQKAFLRAAALPGAFEVLTVTNRELYFKTEDAYRAVNQRNLLTSFILEPFGRNTAPAIAVATEHVAAAHGEDAILLVLPADHLISDQEAFAQAVSQAARLAQDGFLVTFGIVPSSPETGFGYIEAEGHLVRRFVEKPSLKQAKEYLNCGRYLWNSGMFCFRAGSALAELDRHAPDVLAASRACLEASRTARRTGSVQVELDAESFERAPNVSIDYALMEKSGNVAVVACDIGWSDIGSWSALGDLIKPDANGNRTKGQVLLHDVSNCYIESNKRIVGAVGVDNLIVIDTLDAVLIADRSRAQDVKHLYADLKAQGHETHKLHRTVHRPWGTYTVLEEGARFKIKRIEVKPGAGLSLQLHRHRSEHWVVVCGTAKVVNGERELLVHTDESTYIPAGNKHRLENPGTEKVVIIEVQSGEYLGEDDIVRYDDQYGRTTS